MSVLSINDFVIEDGVLIEYRGESTTPVVPEGVIAIAGGAFAFCNVTKVTLPSTVKELGTCGKEVFDKLYHCVNRINICFAPSPEEDWLNTSSECEGFENSLDEDDDFEISFEEDDFEFFDDVFFYEDACQVPWVGPFYCCYNLEEINLPDGLKIIPKGAFCECRKLKEITIPNSVYKIGCDAFYRCEELKAITIPSQVNVIEGGTFQLCKSLESVAFECEHVVRIETGAFSNCKKLNRVTASGEQLSNSLVFNSRFCPFCDTPFLDKRLSEFQEE